MGEQWPDGRRGVPLERLVTAFPSDNEVDKIRDLMTDPEHGQALLVLLMHVKVGAFADGYRAARDDLTQPASSPVPETDTPGGTP